MPEEVITPKEVVSSTDGEQVKEEVEDIEGGDRTSLPSVSDDESTENESLEVEELREVIATELQHEKTPREIHVEAVSYYSDLGIMVIVFLLLPVKIAIKLASPVLRIFRTII